MSEDAPSQVVGEPPVTDAHVYPHHLGEVDVKRLAADIAANPQAYPPIFDPHLIANGIAVDRAAQAEIPPVGTIEASEGGKVLHDYMQAVTIIFGETDPHAIDESELPDMTMVGYAVENGSCTAQEFNDFIKFLRPYDRDDTSNLGYVKLRQLVRDADLNLIREAYMLSDKNEQPAVRELMQEIAATVDYGSENAGLVAERLRQIYGLYDVFELKVAEGNHRNDALVVDVTDDIIFPEVALEAFRYRWSELHGAESPTNGELSEWADRYMDIALGLPTQMRDDFLFGSYGRMSDTETGQINQQEMMYALERIYSVKRHIGNVMMKQLHEQAGIVNFDTYNAFDFRAMAGLLTNNPETIAHLQSGDVTVVMRDALGDHNGAFENTAFFYSTPSARTLYFEVQKPADIYRYMTLLKQRAVQPSTLVMGAHGEPGGFEIGRGDSHFYMNADPSSTTTDFSVAMASAKALPRMVAEYMQDSRGIDDDASSIGRRKIILQSCSQAKPRLMMGKTANGQYAYVDESTASVLTKSINNPSVDLYAGSEDIGVSRTEQGLRFLRFEKDRDGNEIALPLDATKFSVDSNGRLLETRVSEIVLRGNSNDSNDEGTWLI